MSTKTASSDATWSSLGATLAQVLRETPEDEFFAMELACDDDSGASRYVQFCAYGPGMIRCEVVSNEYLAESCMHTVEDLRWLAGQGWGEPGDIDGQGSLNHYLDVDAAWAEFAADQIIRVFRELWGVTGIHEIYIDRSIVQRFRGIAQDELQ